MDTSKTILIVEDDAAVRSSLQFLLEVEGYPVKTYTSGQELLDDHNAAEAGCLIIDYRLQDMNGLDVLSTLQRRKIALPAILITSEASPSLRDRTAAAGVPVVEKPLLTEALVDGVRAAMHERACGPSRALPAHARTDFGAGLI